MYLGEPQPFEPCVTAEGLPGGGIRYVTTMLVPAGYEAEGQRYLNALTNAVLQGMMPDA